MSSDGTFNYPTFGLPVPEHSIQESPPEWWDEYPFDSSEPDWDSVDSYQYNVDGTHQGASPTVIGPNCIPVPISSIRELQYITPISNLESILKLGILSHNQARTIPHDSVANPEVNRRRTSKRLMSGQVVHDYANLYFNARNPMLNVLLKERIEPLCVVRVAARVIRLKGVIVTDGNVANNATREFHVIDDNVPMDRTRIFLRYWPDPASPMQENENKRCIMAAVLVPDIISPHFIEGIHVASTTQVSDVESLIERSKIRISERLFFVG